MSAKTVYFVVDGDFDSVDEFNHTFGGDLLTIESGGKTVWIMNEGIADDIHSFVAENEMAYRTLERNEIVDYLESKELLKVA